MCELSDESSEFIFAILDAMRKRKNVLSIYLIKSGAKAISDKYSFNTYPIKIGNKSIGNLLIRESHSHAPRWLRLFDGHINLAGFRVISASSAAVLLLDVAKRQFALTFGYGKSLLEPGSWEERFGLKVTLNSIAPDKIRSIDKKTFDAISLHTRDQTSREASANDFGLDIERDLVRAVTGIPNDAHLGNRMSGMDALSITVEIDIASLPNLIERLYNKYLDTSYKEHFPWFDNIAEVKDHATIENLNKSLIDALKNNGADKLWMAVPEIIEWSDVGGFKYTTSKSAELEDDIFISKFKSSIKDISNINIHCLKSRKIHCYSNSSGEEIHTWSAFNCIYFETIHDGQTFLLNTGKWYNVDSDFMKHVDGYCNTITDSGIDLPDATEQDEKNYNAQAAKENSDLFLMDRMMIPHGGGRSLIEFCDLYDKNKIIIHVKKYGSASALSHLFAQGANSAVLFLADAFFRKKLNDKLPDTHKINDPDSKPDAEDYKLVFVILSLSRKPLVLPFFSKITLMRTVRDLRTYGYNVFLDRIGPNHTSS